MQKGRLPFQTAAMYGHTEALKLLLKEPGVQVDSLIKVHVYTCYNYINLSTVYARIYETQTHKSD